MPDENTEYGGSTGIFDFYSPLDPSLFGDPDVDPFPWLPKYASPSPQTTSDNAPASSGGNVPMLGTAPDLLRIIQDMMGWNQGNVLRGVKELQDSTRFGGPGLTDLQQTRNILNPRQYTVGLPNLEQEKEMMMFKQQLMLDTLKKMFSTQSGMFSGLLTKPGSPGTIGGTDLIAAMMAENARKSQFQKEGLANQFAAMGRSPASTVMADLTNRIGETEQLSNLAGAGEIQRTVNALQAQMQNAYTEIVSRLMNTMLGGAMGLAGGF